MPPRKPSSHRGVKKKVQAEPDSASTPPSFEAELRNLAQQSKKASWSQWARRQAIVYGKTASLLAIMAVYSNVSQLTLSPVYGAIPSSLWHSKVVMAACFLGWASNLALGRMLPVRTPLMIPLVAAYSPVVQFFLFRLSGLLKASYGPLLTEMLTLFPLILLGVASVADELEAADLSRLPTWASEAAPGLVSYAFYKSVETLAAGHLQERIGMTFLHTRLGMELALAATTSIMAPSRYLIFAIPAALHAAFLNTHVMTPSADRALNATLIARAWSLVDRGESATGYVSVLDSKTERYRVMRCDHSLLGGEWLLYPKQIVGEPIYAVFATLEAIRLIQVPDKVADQQARALNIGLGIGTTSAALIAHGIDTTIVEIDPLVYHYAIKYFDLPRNHTAAIEDAVTYTARAARDESQRFDYIIHDVFTGGAEPIPLFTLEFLQTLRTLLKPNGLIAINYAGDFMLPPLSSVVGTIRAVFPSCRVFREAPGPPVGEDERDFDNVMVFCRKSGADKITFRDPVEADFLRTRSRQLYLVPRNEVAESDFLSGPEVGIVAENSTHLLRRWHAETAVGHWGIIRDVVPGFIWENW